MQYHSAILNDSQNQKVSDIISDLKKLNLFRSLNEVETFTSGGGYLHTLILCKNGHIVAIHFEDNLLEYSARPYISIDSYLSEEMQDRDMGFGYEFMQEDYDDRNTDLEGNTLRFLSSVSSKKMAKGGSLDDLQIDQISRLTGVRSNAIREWVSENNLSSNDVSNIMMGLGRKQIKPIDFSTAIVGKPNNKYSKQIIMFAKSNSGYKMAEGGVIGQEIVFDDNGEQNTGVIKDIHENTGDYIVLTDDGRTVLAQKELDVISLGKMRTKAEPKKRFSFFKDGGELSPMQKQKFGKVMDEWKKGKLHSGSKDGPIVTDQDQAVAIAFAEARSMKKMAKGGSTEKSKFGDIVYTFLVEHGYDISTVDYWEDGTFVLYPSTEKVGTHRKDFFDGMQIIKWPDGQYEVSEYMAGPNNDQTFIYKQTKSLNVALKDLIRGNNRKPVEKYDLGGDLNKEDVANETNQMFHSQIKEAKHHIEELSQVANKNMQIEPWVLAKMTRAKTDLSDLTHYLEGLK
jgi:hypothetical protein